MANKIKKAYLLADPKNILAVKTAGGRSVITLPKRAPDTINTVVVVEFLGEPAVAASPVSGKQVVASSQQSISTAAGNVLDGDRQTQWEAAKGERSGSLELDLAKPYTISTLIIDEPWHPWENKKQEIVLQHKTGNDWITIVKGTSGGSGYVQNFKPVTAQNFRLLIENKDREPVILEWQLYGPE